MPKEEISGLTEFYEQFGIRPRYGDMGCEHGTPAINRIMDHVHYVVDRQIIDLQNKLESLASRIIELEKRIIEMEKTPNTGNNAPPKAVAVD